MTLRASDHLVTQNLLAFLGKACRWWLLNLAYSLIESDSNPSLHDLMYELSSQADIASRALMRGQRGKRFRMSPQVRASYLSQENRANSSIPRSSQACTAL
jgi:hypothetical protein